MTSHLDGITLAEGDVTVTDARDRAAVGLVPRDTVITISSGDPWKAGRISDGCEAHLTIADVVALYAWLVRLMGTVAADPSQAGYVRRLLEGADLGEDPTP